MSNPNIASRFDEIYNSTNKAVLIYITAKCGRTTDINDIFQDTYMELYQILENRGVGYVTNEQALIMRIAKRKIAKYYSFKQRIQDFTAVNALTDDGEETNLSDLADSFMLEDFAINQTLLETARQFIYEKPKDIRKIFYLMYDLDLTIPQIAKALSMSESNVKNKLYRTLKQLRNLLE